MTLTPGIVWTRGYTTALLLLALCLPWSARGSEQDLRRVLIGLKLFPAVLAADQEIQNKAASNGQLTLLVLFRENRQAAEQLVDRLEEVKEGVRNLPLAPRALPYTALADYPKEPLAGVFIAEQLPPDQLGTAIAFARARRMVLFSPFQEDVEQGVATGLYVSDRILPYVNLTALREANLRLKPFFLEVAKHHE